MTVFGVPLAEPDVALTDWALALEAFALAWLARGHGGAWMAFFGAIGMAALLGGIAHGFFPDRTPAAVVVWRTTVLVLGVSSVAAFMAGARALAPGSAARLRRAAIAFGVAYAAVVLLVSDAFVVALVGYLPATLFLLWVFATEAPHGEGASLAGVAGIAVLLTGSGIQWKGVGLTAIGLGPNAVFHVIEMVALPLIYAGMRGGRP